jgi:lysozyme
MATAKQKKKIRRLLLTLVVLMLLGVAVWRGWQWWQLREARYTHYPAFGISIPGGYSIHGIDVSKYQHLISWEGVKRMKVENIQLGFTFIKATEGTSYTDPQFGRNWKRSAEAGMIRGAYHFFIGSRDGKAQAANYIKEVDLIAGDFPPVLDIEQLNGTSAAQLKREAKEWLEIVEAHYGVKPLIYTNVDFYNRFLGTDFDEYPLWVAHYYQPEQPRISRGWLFWQHSDRGRVNGIVSPVDFNVFNGDSAAFRQVLLQ